MLIKVEVAEVPEKTVRRTLHGRAKVGGTVRGVAANQVVVSNAGSATEVISTAFN